MRQNINKIAAVAAFGIGVALSGNRAFAQIGVGSMGATTSMMGTLGGMGNNAPSASRITRGLPSSTRAGSDAAFGGANPSGGSPFGGNDTESPTSTPAFPNASTATTVARTVSKPLYWTEMRGADFLNELRGRPTRRSNAKARGVRNNPRRPLAKYKVPPRNWLAFYPLQDRYKITLNIWRYVSIEDDRGRYPVRYYYRPNAPTFLSLLANAPRGIVRPYRIIGFASWQDAMIAGYRPDAVSKPEPALGVLALGRLSESSSVMRYIEATYAGQISPNDFRNGVSYAQQIARVVGSRRDTRSKVRPVVAEAVGALLGEGPFPTSVTGNPVRVVRRVVVPVPVAATNGQNAGASNNVTPGMASISGDANVGSQRVPDEGNRSEGYNRFRSNAANLRAR